MREKFKQCHAQVSLAQASGDVFDQPNNPIGCLHSSSFHTSLYYLHEQLQPGVVGGYCRFYCARVFTYACRSLPAAVALVSSPPPFLYGLRWVPAEVDTDTIWHLMHISGRDVT